MSIKREDVRDFGSPINTDDYYKSTQKKTYKEALDEFAEKHSEMMTPWAVNNYHDMEHWYPDPDPKPWTWDWNPRQPPGTIIDIDSTEKPNMRLDYTEGLCILPCDGRKITSCGEEEEYICDLKPIGGVALTVYTSARNTKPGDNLNIFAINVDIRSSKNIEEMCGGSGPPTGAIGGDQLVITFNDENVGTGTLHIEAHMTAIGCGHAGITRWRNGQWITTKNTCIADIRIECELCDTSTPVAYDRDNSADTVAPNNSASVAITGSGTPFTWAISGTGTWSLTNSETAGLTNTVNAGGDACGTATITITDCDENTATGYIRSTGGQWSAWTEVDREEAGVTQCLDHTTCSVSSSSTTNRCGGYSDKYQWRTLTGISGDCSCSGSTPCSTGSGCPTDGGICYNAITVSDGPCSYSPTNFGWCYVILQRREWECVP